MFSVFYDRSFACWNKLDRLVSAVPLKEVFAKSLKKGNDSSVAFAEKVFLKNPDRDENCNTRYRQVALGRPLK